MVVVAPSASSTTATRSLVVAAIERRPQRRARRTGGRRRRGGSPPGEAVDPCAHRAGDVGVLGNHVGCADEPVHVGVREPCLDDFEALPFTVDPLESLYPGGPDGRADGNNVGGGRTGIRAQAVKWTARDFAAVQEGQLPMGEAALEWSHGDVEDGLAAAALVLDETFVTAGNSHHVDGAAHRDGLLAERQVLCALGQSEPDGLATGDCATDRHRSRRFRLINEFCGGGFGSKGTAGTDGRHRGASVEEDLATRDAASEPPRGILHRLCARHFAGP